MTGSRRTSPRPRIRPLRVAALGALAALIAAATWSEIGARMAPPPEDPNGDGARQRISLERARHAGEAMTAWLGDAAPAASTTAVAAVSDEPDEAAETAPADEPITADWSRCPAVAYEELAAALVPAYLDELPRTDGWGHPLEFCLERAGTAGPRYRIGVRSPGRDGRFEDGAYPVGGFPSDAFDHDLLWLDGYLVSWPQPAGFVSDEDQAEVSPLSKPSAKITSANGVSAE